MNGRARGVLSDATLLSRDTEELAGNISESEQRVGELEGVALSDAEVISMTTNTAQTAINDTRTLKEEIRLFLVSAHTYTRDPVTSYGCDCSQIVLEGLQRELESTELLPGDRLSEVGSMVTQLESQAEENQLIIDDLQSQVYRNIELAT